MVLKRLKKYIFTILGLLVLLASVSSGCWIGALSPSGTKTYRNDSFQYIVSYPNNWSLEIPQQEESSKPEQAIYIHSPRPYFGEVSIIVNDNPEASAQGLAEVILDVYSHAFKEFRFESNQEVQYWDSYFEYSCVIEDEKSFGIYCFKETETYVYIIGCVADEMIWNTPLLNEILASFTLIAQ